MERGGRCSGKGRKEETRLELAENHEPTSREHSEAEQGLPRMWRRGRGAGGGGAGDRAVGETAGEPGAGEPGARGLPFTSQSAWTPPRRSPAEALACAQLSMARARPAVRRHCLRHPQHLPRPRTTAASCRASE